MLARLSDRKHEVATAFVLLDSAGRIFATQVVVSEVMFRRLACRGDRGIRSRRASRSTRRARMRSRAAPRAFVRRAQGIAHQRHRPADGRGRGRAAGCRSLDRSARGCEVSSTIAERYRPSSRGSAEAAAALREEPPPKSPSSSPRRRSASTGYARSSAAGARDIGENYVQEATPQSARQLGLPRVRWHMIGRLQRNKVKQALRALRSDPLARSARSRRALDSCGGRIGRTCALSRRGQPRRRSIERRRPPRLVSRAARRARRRSRGSVDRRPDGDSAAGTRRWSRRPFARCARCADRLGDLRLPQRPA